MKELSDGESARDFTHWWGLWEISVNESLEIKCRWFHSMKWWGQVQEISLNDRACAGYFTHDPAHVRQVLGHWVTSLYPVYIFNVMNLRTMRTEHYFNFGFGVIFGGAQDAQPTILSLHFLNKWLPIIQYKWEKVLLVTSAYV